MELDSDISDEDTSQLNKAYATDLNTRTETDLKISTKTLSEVNNLKDIIA